MSRGPCLHTCRGDPRGTGAGTYRAMMHLHASVPSDGQWKPASAVTSHRGRLAVAWRGPRKSKGAVLIPFIRNVARCRSSDARGGHPRGLHGEKKEAGPANDGSAFGLFKGPPLQREPVAALREHQVMRVDAGAQADAGAHRRHGDAAAAQIVHAQPGDEVIAALDAGEALIEPLLFLEIVDQREDLRRVAADVEAERRSLPIDLH